MSLLPGLVLNVAASETPSFIENFDSYTSTDGTVTSAKQFTGEPEVIAVHPSGAKWITSAKKHGNFLNGLYWGHSYIDVSSDTLYVRGHGRFPVAVNLEFN